MCNDNFNYCCLLDESVTIDDAIITVPTSVLRNLSNNYLADLFVYYNSSILFPLTEESIESNNTISSPVIAASVLNTTQQLTNLTEPVVISLPVYLQVGIIIQIC